MSKPSLDQIRGGKAPSVTELVAETRIDKAHPAASATQSVARSDEATRSEVSIDHGIDLEMLNGDSTLTPGPSPERRGEPSPPDPAAISRNMESQASQLAEHLRGRQKELDHREAELNAWAAKLERDSRAARLWFEEQQAAIAEAAVEPGTVLLQDDAVRRKAEKLAAREQQLAEVDAELAGQRTALQKFHEQLTAERQLLDDHSRAERERAAAEEARLAADIERQRRQIEQRGEHVDQSRAALEQFRAELSRMHRETLEIRLASEELWAELSGSTPPAELIRSLGRIRSRLADHYRMADADLEQKKNEIERLRDHLSEQYEKLVRQKRSFDEWAAACRDEAEQQASRLQAQAEDVERREADMGEYARAVQSEKLELQQELRRLRSKLVARASVELPV